MSSNNGKLTPETREKIHYACGLILKHLHKEISGDRYDRLQNAALVRVFGDWKPLCQITQWILMEECGMEYTAALNIATGKDASSVYMQNHRTSDELKHAIDRGIEKHESHIAARLPGYKIIVDKIREYYSVAFSDFERIYTFPESRRDKVLSQYYKDVDDSLDALKQEYKAENPPVQVERNSTLYNSNGNGDKKFNEWALSRLSQDPTNPTVQQIRMRLMLRDE